MKIKITVVALIAVTAGVFAYTRPHTAMPADLRDAVADSALGTLKGGTDASDMKMPEPTMAPVAAGAGSKSPRSGIFLKGEFVPNGDVSKGFGGKAMLDARFDKAASSALSKLPGATPYEKLKALFERGVPATRADLTGWKAGRSFRTNGFIGGAFLAGQRVKIAEEVVGGGPLFAPQNKEGFSVVLLESSNNGEFDELTPRGIAWVKGMIAQGDNHWIMEFSEKGSVSHVKQLRVEERKADGYIVERFSKAGDPGIDSDTVYTYYFKALPYSDALLNGLRNVE